MAATIAEGQFVFEDGRISFAIGGRVVDLGQCKTIEDVGKAFQEIAAIAMRLSLRPSDQQKQATEGNPPNAADAFRRVNAQAEASLAAVQKASEESLAAAQESFTQFAG